MKYIVELKYTNPSHEHVSLRRRVESTSRLVEARSEEEAVFRASNQQKALGFFVTEAKATAIQEAAKKVDFMKFGKDFLSQKLSEAVSFGRFGGVMNYDPKTEKSEKPTKGVSALDKNGNLVGHYRDLETAKKMKPGHTYQTSKGVAKEEVEQVEEAKNVTKDLRVSMKAMDLRHGVDSDKRVSGYKMSPAVRAAQKKSDALSKVVKRPQAGTLAAKRMAEETEVQYIEEKLTAADPASEWIKDFVASDNPKFAGKSKKERINMALGAYYAAKRSKNEATEKKYNEKEVKHDEKKQEKKRGSLNKVKMEPEMEISSQGVK
jgi:hypothetical protein